MLTQPNVSMLSTSRSFRLRFMIILGMLTGFAPFSTDMYLPAFPMMTDELGTNVSLIQLSLTACLLGIAAGQIFFGPLSDIYGRRSILMISLIIYTGVSVLCALVSSIGLLIGLRFLQGFAGAGGIVIARACIRDVYSGPEFTRAYSLQVLIMGIAPILAPIIGAQLLHITSWRGIFTALFLLGVLALAAVIFGLPETLPVERRSKIRRDRLPWPKRCATLFPPLPDRR